MKAIIIVLLAFGVIGGGVFWWYERTASAAVAAEKAAVQNQMVKVQRRTLRLSVMAYGSVASNQDVDIKCQASGVVIELPYRDVGARVAPGALLMRLDPKDEKPPLDLANAVVRGDESKVLAAQENCEIAANMLANTKQQDQANLVTTKATLDDAQAKAHRTDELFHQNLASQEDLETANTTVSTAAGAYKSAQIAMDELPQTEEAVALRKEDLRQAEAQLDQDKSRAATAQQALDYCTVNAPDAKGRESDPPDWYVTALGLNLNIGYLVQSGSSGFSGGTTVMTLSDMSHIFVLATVDESDIGRVEDGQDVRITADSYPGVQFSGKVMRIAPKGVNNSNVVTFEVKIEVLSANKELLKRILMTTNVEIVEAEKKDALVVPVLAVSRQHADGEDDESGEDAPTTGTATTSDKAAATQNKGRHDVKAGQGPFPATVQFVKPDGSVETRDIQVGMNDGEDYEVISGLAEGDTVMLNKLNNSKWRSSSTPVRPSGHR